MKKSTRIKALGLALLMATALSACGDAGSSAVPAQETPGETNTATDAGNGNDNGDAAGGDLSGQTIKFGVAAAITGDVPLEGERMQQAVQMAVDKANDAGGINGAMLEPVFEDEANNADTAVNVVNMFGSDNSLVASIGPHRSTNILAVEQIALRYELPILTGGTSPTFYELDNPYIFRIRGSDTLVAKIAAQFATGNLEKTKVALLYANDDYGNGARQVIEEFLAGMGGELVASEAHNVGDKDMTGQLLNCKNAGADVIIGWTHTAEAAIIARQYKELGMDDEMEFVGCPSWANGAFYSMIDPDIADGTYACVDYNLNNPDPFSADFSAEFEERYNAQPDNHTACYYDAALILIDSIQRAADKGEVTRETVRQALSEQPPINGNQGEMYADGIDMVHQSIIVINKDGAPQYMETVSE